jgi:anti-sigma B factor antagonist
MELNFKKTGNIVVIYLKGRLDVHYSADIEQELERLIPLYPQSHFLVNMQEVEYISSSGLRIIVMAMKLLKEQDRKMVLCCINEAVRKVFEVVQVIDMFHVYSSEPKALEFLQNL